MLRPFPRAVTLLGAFLAALTALTGPALAVGSGRTSGSASPSLSSSPASRLLLINGAQVVTGRNGAPPQIFPAGRGLAGTVELVRLGSRTLAIPLAALPFLGHGLSPSLFDLSALAHSEREGRLPLTLTFRARLQAPPGVTVTRTGPGTAQGYLTPAGARQLGAALARQFSADHDAGSYGTDGLFAGGLTLDLAGPPSAPVPVQPDFPLHTLTLTATALNGRPDTGDEVLVFNVDKPDALGFDSANFFYHGSVKFSVPSGTYWAVALFVPVSGNVLDTWMDVLPQFTVRGKAASAHLSARAATAKVSFAVPRPANLQLQGTTITRESHGPGGSTAVINLQAGGFTWVNPVTRAPSHGGLTANTDAWLTSPGHQSMPYTYSINRVDPAGLILRDQRDVVRPGDLATVQENYDQDVRTTAGPSCTAAAATFPVGVCVGADVRRPGSEVQYLTASPASRWMSSYSEYAAVIGGQVGGFQPVHAGEKSTQEWNRYPLHPAPNVSPPGFREVASVPSAVRAGNTLSVQITPFSDNVYGHTGSGFSTDGFVSYKISGRYAIYSNGVRIAAGNAVKAAAGLADLGVTARLSSRPSVIKLVLTASRASRRFLLSAVSRDVWTWPSRPEPKANLTGPWTCSSSLTSASRHCAVQGMLALRYFVAGISPSGTTAPGRQRIGLAVDHLQEFRSSRVTSVGAQVSFNGGKTWQPAAVRRNGPARFSLAFTASPSLVTLRVTARDTAGDTITETLPGAYRVAKPQSAPATGALRAACPVARPGWARCFVLYRTLPRGTGAAATSRPVGLTPRDIQSAYRLPFRRNPRQTVAIVDAFRTPHLRQYVALYRKQFGLPACGGCLKIVNQRGQAGPLPASGARSGWDVETTLDVDMVSVACPRCRILLVQANNGSIVSLAASENTAARLGAPVISNSYGGTENGFDVTLSKGYDHPGHVIVVSSGDDGYGQANFPADLATVTAVGGTELHRSGDARGWRESVWNDHSISGGAAASGCSAYVAKPAWQHDPHCPGRTIADVSAVANDVPIYDKLWGGWLTLGGTSVAAPLIAGVYGLAGNAARLSPGSVYKHRSQLFDVRAGENAFLFSAKATCGDDYLCVAKKGYDAPTGLGTPDGTGAF